MTFKIAIIGASGKAGQAILKESLSRGFQVTAIVRNKNKITQSVNIIEKEVLDLTTDDLKQFDVVANAFGSAPGQENSHVTVGKFLIGLLTGLSDTRLMVVGGAASLYIDDELKKRILDKEDFSKEYLPLAKAQAQNLTDLKASEHLRFTFVSPAINFDPNGARTGKYQTTKDRVIFNSQGKSYVSYADFAVAFVDEIENPQHLNSRFGVISEQK
ncbi:putative oxidoreductase [Parasitella parasitica]|nr:putative oxidoreductase [Parasitella parasitica]